MQHDVCQKRSSVIFCQMTILNPFDDDAVTRKMAKNSWKPKKSTAAVFAILKKGIRYMV